MIVVMGIVEIDPANLDAMKGPIATMERASRAEPGCHDYTLSVEVSDASRIRITELWESMEALAEHFKLPHMQEFQSALAAYPPRSMTVKVYELGAERSLPGASG